MAVSIAHSDGSTVSGNICTANYFYGIEIPDSANVTVTGNTIDGTSIAGAYGIMLDGVGKSSHNTSISGNTIIRCPTGISVQSGEGTSITGNTIFNGRIGINVVMPNVTITGNVIDCNNIASPVGVFATSGDLVVVGNRFRRMTGGLAMELYVPSGTVDRVLFVDNICDQLMSKTGAGTLGPFVTFAFRRVDVIVDVNSNVRQMVGDNTPEGAATAGVGSTFVRRNGGAATTFYVKESGTGNTGWVAK